MVELGGLDIKIKKTLKFIKIGLFMTIPTYMIPYMIYGISYTGGGIKFRIKSL